MNWDAVGAIGQVLGSVAVFVTLIYLAIQVRHSRAESRREMTLGRLDMARQNMLQIAGSQTISARVRLNRSMDAQSMPFVATLSRLGTTEEDAYRLHYESFAGWVLFVYLIHNIGQMTAGEREALHQNVRRTYGAGIGKLWYESTKTTADADVVRYIDNLLAQPG